MVQITLWCKLYLYSHCSLECHSSTENGANHVQCTMGWKRFYCKINQASKALFWSTSSVLELTIFIFSLKSVLGCSQVVLISLSGLSGLTLSDRDSLKYFILQDLQHSGPLRPLLFLRHNVMHNFLTFLCVIISFVSVRVMSNAEGSLSLLPCAWAVGDLWIQWSVDLNYD